MPDKQRRTASGSVFFVIAGLALATPLWTKGGGTSASPIHFLNRPLGFVLENCETATRYAPETMAGGIAVLDYDNDGDLDIFFTNGADIATLKKTSEKYWNRLYRNDGKGVFTDVTRIWSITRTTASEG